MKPLILPTTTTSITALLGGAITTNQPDFTSHYGDATSSAFTEGATHGTLNGTTPVTLVAAPAASTRRIVNQIIITNTDTAAITLTIRYTDGATHRRLWYGTLQTNEAVTFNGTFDASGALKTAISTVPDHTHTGSGSGGTLTSAAISDFSEAVDDRVTALVSVTDGLREVYDDGANTLTFIAALRSIAACRLTLTSATPVTVTNVTAATSVYVTPYKGSQIALYDGTEWRLYNFTEITVAVPATTATNYDVFVYDSGGITAEAVAWTNDTTRATALALQDGVAVKTGALGRRYVGSFRTTAVSGQTEDSLTKRFCWSFYNQVRRALLVTDTTDSWTVSSTSFQSLNGSTANRVEFIIGGQENPTQLLVHAWVNGIAAQFASVGVGLDSTTVNSANIATPTGGVASVRAGIMALYDGFSGVGYHFLQILERVSGGTVTYLGDNGDSTVFKTGGSGWLHG